MKTLELIIVFLIFSFVQSIWADEIVLQNGLNGYEGCEDAFLMEDFSDNFGDRDFLVIEWEDC